MKKLLLSLIFILFLSPTVVLAETNCVVVDGDEIEIGTEVACGDEHFYIMSVSDYEVKMLTKENLKVGENTYRVKIEKEEGDTTTDEAYCENYARDHGGYTTSKTRFKEDGYCTYYTVNNNRNNIIMVYQDKDSSFNQWDDDGNNVFPQKNVIYLDRGRSSNDYTTAFNSDYVITYTDTRYKDFAPISYNTTTGYLNEYLKDYKKTLEYNGYSVNDISIVSMTDLQKLVKDVSDKTIDLTAAADNVFNNGAISKTGFLDLKEYLPEKYSWLYSVPYWNKTYIAKSGYGPRYSVGSGWYYLFTSVDGMLHASSFSPGSYSDPETYYGNGLRPVVSMPKSNIVFKNKLGVTIESIEYVERGGNTRINDDATTDGTKINLDLVFFEVGDYVKYNIVARNDTEKGLFINSDYITGDKVHVKYEFDSNFIESGEAKTISMKVYYNSPISSSDFDNGVYDASSDGPVVFSNQILSSPNTLKNIGLLGILLFAITFISIVIGIGIIIRDRRLSKTNIMILFFMILVIPLSAKAFIRVDIPVNAKVLIKQSKLNPCTFDGDMVQGTKYINGQFTYSYKQEGAGTSWRNIEDDGWGVLLTDKKSTDPVNTELCTSINGKPIITMRTMFSDCYATKINLSSFDTSNVTSMENMFSNTMNVKKLDVGYFDTSKVTNMNYMFYSNAKLEYIVDVDNFDTSNVTNMEVAFGYNKMLKKLKITKWDFSKAENVSNLFNQNGYYSGTLDFTVKNMSVPSVTKFNYVFYNLGFNSFKTNIDIENIEAINATEAKSLSNASGYSSIKSNMIFKNINLSNSTDSSYMFNELARTGNDINISISDVNIEKHTGSYNNLFSSIGAGSKENLNLNIDNININSATRTYSIFSDICYSCGSANIKVNNIKLNSLTSLDNLFDSSGENTKGEFKIEVTNIQARNATSAYNTFLYGGQSSRKTTIIVKNWDTPNLTSTRGMFNHAGQSAREYMQITVDHLNTTNVTDMSWMFYCVGEVNQESTKIYFIDFDTSKVTTMEGMFRYFAGSSKEVILDGIKNFDYSNVTNFRDMFCYCIRNAENTIDMGTMDIYATDISYFIHEFRAIKAVINLHVKPTNFTSAINDTARGEGREIVINYTSAVDNIDEIIAEAYEQDNVIKGSLIED